MKRCCGAPCLSEVKYLLVFVLVQPDLKNKMCKSDTDRKKSCVVLFCLYVVIKTVIAGDML